jgi:hypothetical protein
MGTRVTKETDSAREIGNLTAGNDIPREIAGINRRNALGIYLRCERCTARLRLRLVRSDDAKPHEKTRRGLDFSETDGSRRKQAK